MFASTVPSLQCPAQTPKRTSACGGNLNIVSGVKKGDLQTGELQCRQCGSRYPILAGVAVLVPDVREYLIEHVKGVSQLVADTEIPKNILRDYLEAKEQIQIEHVEEDLEAERVVALYVMNHFLKGAQVTEGVEDPLLRELILKHWDSGPLERIADWVTGTPGGKKRVVELSCGVGGLYPRIAATCSRYLGVDSSFTSVAIGRHLALGAAYKGRLRVPRDLLYGPVSAQPRIEVPRNVSEAADLVVGQLESFPVKSDEADVAVAMNTIDMLPEPELLPKLQYRLLVQGGLALQSGPYIWHEWVAKRLRKSLPKELRGSAAGVTRIYEKAGFQVQAQMDAVPWLFFKHIRQLEIYSVHLLQARK